MCAALGTQLSAQEKLSNEEIKDLVWSNVKCELNVIEAGKIVEINGATYEITDLDDNPKLNYIGGSIEIDSEPLYGDLNEDDVVDMIVPYNHNPGGNAIINYYATFISVERYGSRVWTFIGNQRLDMVTFEELKNGILFGYELGYDEGDGHCCPSLKREVIYKWRKNQLIAITENEWIK
jgi:hypothetical protein